MRLITFYCRAEGYAPAHPGAILLTLAFDGGDSQFKEISRKVSGL